MDIRQDIHSDQKVFSQGSRTTVLNTNNNNNRIKLLVTGSVLILRIGDQNQAIFFLLREPYNRFTVLNAK